MKFWDSCSDMIAHYLFLAKIFMIRLDYATRNLKGRLSFVPFKFKNNKIDKILITS